jgi:hypothetical protein
MHTALPRTLLLARSCNFVTRILFRLVNFILRSSLAGRTWKCKTISWTPAAPTQKTIALIRAQRKESGGRSL